MRVIRWAALIGVLAIPLGLLASKSDPPLSDADRARRDFVLDNVVLVTPGLARDAPRRLVARDGRIVAIEPTASSVAPPRFVLPGLVDMHVHLPPRLAPGLVDLFLDLLLAHGVTSIREVGSLDGQAFAIADQVARGERRGPRIFPCGRLLDGEPATLPVAREVRTPRDGNTVVRELASRGARCVKVYEGIGPEVLGAIRLAASERGLVLLGHLPAALPLSDLPLDDVQHLCYTRCGSASPEEIDAFVEASARKGVAHTPTLVVFEGQRLLAEARARTAAPPWDLMPRFWRDTLWRPIGESPHESTLASMQALVGRLHARGVRLHAGTDPIQAFVVPGASLHREIALLVDAGLSNEEALAAATWRATDRLGVPALGRIEVGAPADLIVLRKDPTRDLAALGTLEAVVANGFLHPIETLRRAVREDQSYFDRAAVDLPYRALARIAVAIAERSLAHPSAEVAR